MTTIKTIIQGNTNSLRTSASETLTSDFSNIHQTTNGVFVKQTTSDISKRNTGIYILVSIAGVFLILGIITFVVRRRKRAQAEEREKSYETIITDGQTQYINMADNTHHYDVIGYRSERGQEVALRHSSAEPKTRKN